jgi:hypothetical protein
VPVAGAGLQGAVDATQDAFTKNLQEQKKTAEANLSTSRTDIQSMLAELQGKTNLTNDAYSQKGGVDAVQTELNDINQKILVEQTSLQRQIEKLEKNSRGMLSGGLQDQLQDVERESLRKQADLSIIQMGVQGRYDSAKAIADRAVSAYMEKQDLILKTAMFNYTENKELFTTAEQREFETLAQNRQNEIDTQKEEKKSIYDLGLQAQLDGAPTSVIESIFGAKTKEEALQLGSQYIGAQDRALKAEQIASARRANQPSPVKRDTQVVDGKLIDMQTGEVISNLSSPTSNSLANALGEGKIDNINNILNSKAMDSVVGTSGLSRTEPGLWNAMKRTFAGVLAGGATGAGVGAVFGGIGAIPGAIIGALTTGVVRGLQGTKDELTGSRQSFISSVEQMTGGLTLDNLINAKSQGATFGALSIPELKLLEASATKIKTWAIHEGGDVDKPIVGYNIDEKSFKREMDTINYYTKLDQYIKGANPTDIGAVQHADGTVWVLNSDGTYSQLKK